MALVSALGRGFRGHPNHPPLTDLTVGAFTVATATVIVGWFGVLEDRMVDVAFVSVVVGLISSVATILTGLSDYTHIPRGTPLRRTASVHWVSMSLSVALFLVGAPLLQPGANDGQMPVAGGAVALVAWTIMFFGAWVGGSIVYVYGMRVLNEADTPTGDALRPKLPPD